MATINTINQLPDLCLRTIFAKLPLVDVLQMDRVCTLWEYYQTYMCHRLNTLTLLIGVGNPADRITGSYFTVKHADKLVDDVGSRIHTQLPPNGPECTQLRYDSLDWSTMLQLATKLPNINRLEVAINWASLEPTFSQLIHLLGCWAPALVDLKMWFFFNPEPGGAKERNIVEPYFRLLHALNQLPVLERLTLDTPTALFRGLATIDHSDFPRIDSLFARLREFRLDSTDSSLVIQPLCTQLIEPNMTRLEQIGLGSCVVFNSTEDLQQFPSNLAHRLVACQIGLASRLDLNSLPHFTHVIAPFSALTTLQLGNIHLKVLFDTMATLAMTAPNLQQLELCRVEFDDAQPLCSFDHHVYPQLASVLVFSIHVDETFNIRTLLHSRHWQWLLPKMQVLELHGYCFKLLTAHNRHQIIRPDWIGASSRRNLVQIFEQCPSLRHVFTRYQLPLNMPEEQCMYEQDQWELVETNGDHMRTIEYVGTRQI